MYFELNGFMFFITFILFFYFASVLFLNIAMLKSKKETYKTNNEQDKEKEKENKQEIPKIIWSYWDDQQVPELVKVCFDSWKKNKGYTINILNEKTYKDFIPDLDHGNFDSKTRFADYLRFRLLSLYGGVWMDATIFCTKSIDWLIDQSNKEGNQYTGFYMPNFTTIEDYPIIENWFMACTKDSSFMKDWNKEVQSIQQFENVDAYVNNVRNKNIDLQNIPFPEYLMCHVAAQVVFQENKRKKLNMTYKFSVTSAVGENGPFKYLSDENWSSEQGFSKLCMKEHVTPIIKFRGTEREFLNSTYSTKYIDCLVDLL